MSDIKSRIAIKYGDVAPEAKENFAPTSDDRANFVEVNADGAITQLQSYNLTVKNFANPCEQYSVLLDSTSEIFPEYPEYTNMGYWSNSVTNSTNNFDTPITITLDSPLGNYSSKGFTFTFDTYNNIFCTSLNIKWYKDGELTTAKIKVGGEIQTVDADLNFVPTSAFYFCEAEVEYFNKVVITFYSMNMAYQRLKLMSIDYGYGTYFYGDELRNTNVIQEIDPICREIPINVVDFGLDSKRDINYNFQTKQPLSVYFNNELIQTNFVDTSTRTGEALWDIQTNDYIGYLDKITYMGGMFENKNVVELLNSISEQTHVPFNISADFNDIFITGHIPICTCREAIQKIVFVCVKKENNILKCGVVDTSGSASVEFFMLKTDISTTVPLTRIRQGQSFSNEDKVTEVQLTQYTYIAPSYSEDEVANENTWVALYEASQSGYGNDIVIQFSNPVLVESLRIKNGQIKHSGANFAIIDAYSSNSALVGKEYTQNTIIKSMKNPNLLASDLENIQSITDEPLVSKDNIDDVLEKCYNYYIKNNRVNLNIEQNKHHVKYGQHKYSTVKYGQYLHDKPVNVGDIITAETLYLGTLTGRITSARYNLNGGMLVKECEMI